MSVWISRLFSRKVVMIAACVLMAGCAADDRPKYVAPTSAKSDVAVLKGAFNVAIDEVDGQRVDQGFSLSGSNEVNVAPGTHHLIVLVKKVGGSTPPPQGSGITIDLGPQNNDVYFKFICEKGHTYEFSRRGMWNTRLMVTDENTGQKMDIDTDGPN